MNLKILIIHKPSFEYFYFKLFHHKSDIADERTRNNTKTDRTLHIEEQKAVDLNSCRVMSMSLYIIVTQICIKFTLSVAAYLIMFKFYCFYSSIRMLI